MLKFLKAAPFVNVYSNTIDPFIPEIWANESLAILEENMVAASLVHRDFEPELAQYGSVVHTRRPGEFTSYRKSNIDNVTVQDSTATTVLVPMDQQLHVSFLIRDGEESRSFKDLIETYMAPAMLAQARALDRIVLGQYPRFLANAFGNLGGLTTSNARTNILAVRNILNQNKAYMEGRNMILTPGSETTLLNLDLFVQAQQVGDDGTALKEAFLGRKFGFDMYMCQNMAGPTSGGPATVTGLTINQSGGYAKGATSITIAGGAAAINNGTWFTVAGDDSPQQVTGTTGGATPTAIAFSPGLRQAVANGAVVTVYAPGVVTPSLAVGYGATIAVTGTLPSVGQFVSFTGAATTIYTIISVDTVGATITLDRPLDTAITASDKAFYGPLGQYNLTFHKNAIALVVRPLAMPRAGTGALSAVVNHNNLSMRATITYDGNKQGHLVTLDMLCGIQVLDQKLGAVLLG